jgi:pimeloyl-ACP methyl ester carboxylesterase
VIALALGAALVLRAVILARMFQVAWQHRAHRDAEWRIGPLATARMLVVEYVCLCGIYSIFHPVQRLLCPLVPKPGPHTGPPILLVHGYFCNGGYWWWLRRALRKAGYSQTYLINLEPVFGRIQDYADQVGERVEEIRRETGADQVILIGHSMGGLVSRAYVSDPASAAKVAQVIALGSPFHGTAHADVSLGENARQMKRFNAWLQEMNTAPPPETPFVSIYSYHDNLVAPQDSSHLNFATNHPLKGIGHLELAYSKPVHQLILKALETDRQ